MAEDNIYYFDDIKAQAGKMHNEFELEATVRVFETINYYYNLLPDIKKPGDEIAMIVAMRQMAKQMMSEMSEKDLEMLETLEKAMDIDDSDDTEI